MIDCINIFDQSINSVNKTYENIRRTATGQGDDFTTGCLLDYSYFKENSKMIAIDLSKQQALDADPRAIQQINFTANLDRVGNTTMFFIIEQAEVQFLEVQFNFYQYKMTQYNSLNVKLSNSQLNKLKSAVKNESEVVLRLTSNMIG